MNAFRIMTYNVRQCRGSDGQIQLDRVLQVIAEAAPDIVALQDIGHGEDDQLSLLGSRLGMKAYGNFRSGGNGFLSYFPLISVREYELGEGGCCLRADLDIAGKRIHLFNLRLDHDPGRRQLQVSHLLGPELLGSPSLACPVLVIGDFADFGWGAGNLALLLSLRPVRRPWWRATYPARFPLFGRDRAYLRGDVRILESSILRSLQARKASNHLPLTLTVQVTDPRHFLRLQKLGRNRMEAAPG